MALKRLGPHHYRAMELRLQAHTYPDIAAALHRSETTVRHWFSLEPVFRDAFAAMRADAIDRTRARIDALAPDAVKRLEDLLWSEHSPTALGAVRDVLDRVGLKAPTEHRLGGTGGDAIQIENRGDLTDEQRRERIAALFAAVGKVAPGPSAPG